jgi:hypothetical protein
LLQTTVGELKLVGAGGEAVRLDLVDLIDAPRKRIGSGYDPTLAVHFPNPATKHVQAPPNGENGQH